MKTVFLHFRDAVTNSKAYFAVFKMPMILFTAILGFILEFMIELPFMVLCLLDRGRAEKAPTGEKIQGENRTPER